MSTITLDQDKARAYLNEFGVDTEPLSATWDPRDPGNESGIAMLFHSIQSITDQDIIAGLDGRVIEFVYEADDDGGAYTFSMRIPAPDGDVTHELHLLGTWEEMRKIGVRDAVGPDAAMGILEEAVRMANELAVRLLVHVRYRTPSKVVKETQQPGTHRRTVRIKWSEVTHYEEEVEIDVPDGWDGDADDLVHVDDQPDWETFDLPETFETHWLDRAPFAAESVDEREIEEVYFVDDTNPAYPNGQCPACGWGLDEGGVCRNADCTRGETPYSEASLDETREELS